MAVNRVSTISLHNSSLADMMRLQVAMGTTQNQISSGRKASTFTELSAQGQTARVLGFETQQSRTENYLRGNTIASSRLQQMNTSVSGMIDVAEELSNLLLLRRTPTTGDTLPLSQLAESALAKVAQALNTQTDGRTLFSGSKTNTIPVDTTISNVNWNDDTDDYTLNNAYYSGDAYKASVRANDALEFNYGVTADNPAFQKLIGALNLAIKGDQENDDAILAKAVDLTNIAIKELASVQAGISNNITILDKANSDLEDYKVFLKGAISDVTETDVAEATIKMTSYETTLQATYMAFSRLSSLKLSDFLK